MTQLKSLIRHLFVIFTAVVLIVVTIPPAHPQNRNGQPLESFTYRHNATTIGKLRPNKNLTIKSKLSETVDTFPVSEGSSVEEGQLVLQFDTTTHRIRLERTRHRLERARHQRDISRKTFERKESLLDRDLVSQSEFDQAKLEFKQAQENLSIARSDLEDAQRQYDYTSVESPFPGVLDRHLVELGEQVRRGQPLLKLLQLDPIKVEFEVTPEERQHLARGDSITVRLNEDTRSAEISNLSHDVSPDNGLYSVTADLPNPDHEFIAGRTVDLTVPLRRIRNAVRIPLTHINRSGDEAELILRNPETGEIHHRPLAIIDYEQQHVVIRRTWPESWRLLPGSVYTKTDT